MKKVLTAFLLFTLLCIGTSFGQEKLQTKLDSITKTKSDSVHIIKLIDNMSDKIYYMTNKSFVVINETGKIGFKVDVHISKKIEFDFVTIKSVGIGNCNENDEIIILLENGQKITKKSWQEFNCKGNSYFNLNDNDIILLKSSPLSKIRLKNGRSYDSYTGDVQNKDKQWFIQLFNQLDRKNFTEVNE